jgi:hypothetical protein
MTQTSNTVGELILSNQNISIDQKESQDFVDSAIAVKTTLLAYRKESLQEFSQLLKMAEIGPICLPVTLATRTSCNATWPWPFLVRVIPWKPMSMM